MYFLWKRTPHGTVRISCRGVADFIQRFLAARARLCSVALAEGETALVTLVLSSRAASHEPGIERQLSSLMEPMGMVASVIWFNRGSSAAEWTETRLTFDLHRNPWAWMALASSIALVVIAGWSGLFWTAFWGTAAWFSVRGLCFLLQKRRPFPLGRTERR